MWKKWISLMGLVLVAACGSTESINFQEVTGITPGTGAGDVLSGTYSLIFEYRSNGCENHSELEIPAAGTQSSQDVEVVQDDIVTSEITDASMVVLNLTLQFIPPSERLPLLSRIHAGMRPGGVLILSEKVVYDDAGLNTLLTEMHLDFKRAHGYSELEISQKRTALENVLVPETVAAHRERLLTAGFSSADVWFQCFNFMSMLAVK